MLATHDLSARTFGGLTIEFPDGKVANLQTQRSRALFILLLLYRDRMVHREVLCAKLWPGLSETSARAQLRKSLWRLRSVLEQNADAKKTPALKVAEHQVGLDSTRITADCWRFADLMASVELTPDGNLDQADAEALVEAVEINHDTFAAGLFDEWCLDEQADLHEARLVAMERLVAYHRREENWLQAIRCAHRALRLDPLREHLHMAVMAAWYSMGDRASALRQYDDCAKLLRSELDVAPSPEVRALRAEIRSGARDSIAVPVPISHPRTAPRPKRRTRDIDSALASLATAQNVLQRISDD